MHHSAKALNPGNPFEREGYVVWPIMNVLSGGIDYLFFQGRELVGEVRYNKRQLDRLSAYAEEHPEIDTFDKTVFVAFRIQLEERSAPPALLDYPVRYFDSMTPASEWAQALTLGDFSIYGGS